jgi:WD40 repeat protein
MRILADYLGVSEAEDEELANLEDAEVSGSCQWLLNMQSFIDWRDAQIDGDPTEVDLPARTRKLAISKRNRLDHPSTPRFFWLTGAPGTGKSVLAAHVIRHLEDRDCSFYFLKHSDRSKQNLSGLLKSIAYQMARRDVALRQSLLSMQREGGLTAEKNDIRAIWKQLFVQKIFRTDFQQRQYWIIDALDEGHGGHELVPLLAKIPEHLPISVFLTSRRDLQLERQLNRVPMVTEQIEISNTLGDIRLYLEEHVDDLPVQDPVAVEDLIEKLLNKSKGSFLWVRLIVQQLETIWSDTEIDEVLENVPEGMEKLYSTILEDMTRSSNKALAKAILEWVICAARPLTTAELQEAIRLHIGQRVFKMEDMIEAVCGQLVTVDKQGRVQLVHDTARDFLLDKSLDSVFAIDKASTHEHLADICLRYLISEDTRLQPGRRPLHPPPEVVVPAFQEYANLHFSDHVVKSPSAAADNSLGSLEVFLGTTVLYWIEYIARSGDLSPLTQTAKNLKGYVERRIDFHCPLNPEMQIVQDWAVDLIRVVTVFGRHLLIDPSAIHRIIPALCPQSSMLFRKFMNPTLGLEVVGLSMRGWADRIHSTSYSHNATAVACCEKRYAVGLRTGHVVLYYASTCQEALHLDLGETVKQLEFAHANEWLVVSCKSTMSMWNYKTGLCIWRNDISGEPMSLTITDDDSTIIAATKSNHLISWDTTDGAVLEQDSWHGEENAKYRPPQHVCVSSELNLLALVYRNKPITLLDLGDLTRPRYAGVEDKANVEALAFNPALNQFAVAFYHGEVCTIGIWNLQKIASTLVDASHLAASTDGKTLIVGTNLGSIQIHDFETLKVLYTIRYDDEEITSMTFTGNGLRFLDIRMKEFNVWEPSALVRRKDNDDSTSVDQTSFNTAPSLLVQAYTGNDENMITAMISHHLGDFVFVGKESGVVAIYETARGKSVRELYSHVRTAVTFMEWSSAQEMLVSSDTSSRILVHRVRPMQTRSSTGTRSTWQTHRVLEKRLGEANEAIRQILLSVDGRYLLVSTSTVDHLWSLDGTSVLTLDHMQPNRIHMPSQKWLTHPRHKRQVFEVDQGGVRIIEWEKHHDSEPSVKSMEADPKERIDFELQGIGIHFVRFGEDSWAAYDNNPSTRPVIWPAPPSSLSASAAAAAALAHFNTVVPVMKNILGMFRSQLVFLDLEGWICSMRLDEAGQERPHARHFPIPHCWQSTVRGLAPIVTVKGDVIVANKHELAIVKRGLSL